jgi:putative endonuclease
LLHSGVTLERLNLGRTGEEMAVAALEERGYAILACRYRTRHGEIDIIACDGETTVFIEVKARVTDMFGTAAEAVGRAKQRRLARMAIDYVAKNNLADRPCRFDVVAIDGAGTLSQRVSIYQNAFEMT